MICQFTGIQRLFIVLLIAVGLVPSAATAQGNSDAARACQGEGYLSLVGSEGETFANVGQCVRFAAQGGTFDDGTDVIGNTIVVPAGFSVTFSDQVLAACNELAYGFALNDGPVILLNHKSATDCTGNDTYYYDDVTIGPVEVDSVLVVYLTDVGCDATYRSDGGHGRVVATAPVYEVDMADAGPGCRIKTSSWSGSDPDSTLEGNLRLTVTVHQ